MKSGIHPPYHPIIVVMTDGTEYETRSTLGKEGELVRLRLDVDPKSHQAWTGGTGNIRKTGQMEKFNNRFGNLGSLGKKAAEGG